VTALPSRYVVFSDLDGTLLDHKSYSFAPAQEALYELERRQAPLVLVTSKTRAEVEVLRRKLRNQHPFITENGGGVFIPQGYFPRKIPGETRIARYHCLMLARPYAEIVEELQELAAQSGAQVVGFHDMSAREVAQNTGLGAQEAELARKRDFDEPFFFAGGDAKVEAEFVRLARARGLEVTRGGRFWHLFAGSDKGKATKKLLQLFRAGAHLRLRAVGLGDSANDIPMLQAVDVPYLIPKPDGSLDEEVLAKMPHVHRASAPGPKGWNQAVLDLLG
jgi:mannosyl-3-phosphoglycerate phosphatase family protein